MAETVAGHFNFARDVVERWGKQRPDALALWCVREEDASEEKVTFFQVAEGLRRAASFFDQIGIRRGDRVLVVTHRVPQWWVAVLGLIRLGAVPIPGTPLLTARDIRYRLEAATASALVTDEDGAARTQDIA